MSRPYHCAFSGKLRHTIRRCSTRGEITRDLRSLIERIEALPRRYARRELAWSPESEKLRRLFSRDRETTAA